MTNSELAQASRIRVASADVVEAIALRNHAPFTRTTRAAAVAPYFWAA